MVTEDLTSTHISKASNLCLGVRLCFISILRTSQEAVTRKTATHVTSERPRQTWALREGLPPGGDLSRGSDMRDYCRRRSRPRCIKAHRSSASLRCPQTDSLMDFLPSFIFLVSKDPSVLATGELWKILFPSCFFVIAFQVNHLTGLFYQTKLLFSK